MEAIINISLHIKYLHFDSPTKRLITETKKTGEKIVTHDHLVCTALAVSMCVNFGAGGLIGTGRSL